MQSCFVRVWAGGELEPSPNRVELDAPLPLGREFLGVSDDSVSRAANAPVLTSLGAAAAKLEVPERCTNPVLVVHACNFETLSRGAPGRGFDVSPTELRRRGALILSAHSSLALLRSARFDRPGPIDHLVPLPRAERVQPGHELLIDAPALLAIGRSAVALLPGETVLPNSALDGLPAPRSFRLPSVGVTRAAALELDDFLQQAPPKRLELGGWTEPFRTADLPQVAARLLRDLHSHYAFLPALIDGREPRLVLLYEGRNGGGPARGARPVRHGRDHQPRSCQSAHPPRQCRPDRPRATPVG